jgi:hypothetical protein
MGPIELAALSGAVVSNSVIVVQTQSFIQPAPTPSVPAEATAFSRMHQMTPDLFLHPVFDVSDVEQEYRDAMDEFPIIKSSSVIWKLVSFIA